MASVTIFRLPVLLAQGSSDVVLWKAAPMEQPRPQGVAQKQACLSSLSSVRMALRMGDRWNSKRFAGGLQ